MTEGYTNDWSLPLNDFLIDDSTSFTADFSFDDWLDWPQTGAVGHMALMDAQVSVQDTGAEPHQHARLLSADDLTGPNSSCLSPTFSASLVSGPITAVDSQNGTALSAPLETPPQVFPATGGTNATSGDVAHTCHCGQSFRSLDSFHFHCAGKGHVAFSCTVEDCGSTFSRKDVYHRHMIKHNDNATRFSCNLCKRHRGVEAFKRKDRLTQHMRNYHHVDDGKGRRNEYYDRRWCPHPTCSESKETAAFETFGKRNAFKNASEHTAHLKKVHNESPYPCTQPGCDRVDGKGYFRERDLMKHQKKIHAKKFEADV